MTVILGLDIASRTGWAYYDDKASLSAIRVGHIQCEGEEFEDKSAFLGKALVKLIKSDRPDFVLIERPMRAQPIGGKRTVKFMGEEQTVEAKGSGINAVISSNQLVGAASAIIGAYNIPFETIASVSWRKAFLGFGTHKGWE